MLDTIEFDNISYVFSVPEPDDGEGQQNPNPGEGQQNPNPGGGTSTSSTKVGNAYVQKKRDELVNAVKKAGVNYPNNNSIYKNVKIKKGKVSSFSFGSWVDSLLPLDNKKREKSKIDLNYNRLYYSICFLYWYGAKITKTLDQVETKYGKTTKNSIMMYSKKKKETDYLKDLFYRKDGKYRISDGKTKAEIKERFLKSKEYIFYSLQRMYGRMLKYYGKEKYPISYNSLSSNGKHFDHTTSYKTGTIFKISAYNSKKEIRGKDLKTRYEKGRDGYRKYAIKDGYEEIGKTTRGGGTFDMVRNKKTETFTFYDCNTKKTLTTYENGGGGGSEYRSTGHIANTAIFQGYSVQAACALAGQAPAEVPHHTPIDNNKPTYVYMNRYGVSDAYNSYNVSFGNYTSTDLDKYLNTTYRQVGGTTRRCAGDGLSHGIKPCPTKMPSVWKSKGLMTTTNGRDFTYYFEAYYEVDQHWKDYGTVNYTRILLSEKVYNQFRKQTGHKEI